jgi:hypothetical protein
VESLPIGEIMFERIKAWYRGEKRLAVPRGVRGRVYQRKNDSPGSVAAKTKLEATMTARVYRAAEDRWEDI